ncbi:hypothetical protein EQG49_11070 [Periweissella cryptocerci]|uniref:Uncharacterized protein n=1 Tax=Periweissella cryptocerci TaxID=2506420 RepID=A0A4P6YW34_9LACO|nr:hypothetical protein [Periweissella cryptocerci]QBO36947.1 hypothetical protein EQG49_11070 [Periweissella cryptocerci]
MTVKEKLPVTNWDTVLEKLSVYWAPTMLLEELRDWAGHELDSNEVYYFADNNEIVAEDDLVDYLNDFGLDPANATEALEMASEEQLIIKEIKGY